MPKYDFNMEKAKMFGLSLAAAVALGTVGLFVANPESPGLSTYLFWIAVLVVADVLPVSLGYEAEVTMAFPIHLAIEILFLPPVAMVMAGAGAVDLRELRREIPLWRAFFNRAQLMASVGAASAVIHAGDVYPFSFPAGAALIALGATVHFIVNIGLVGTGVSLDRGLPLWATIRSLPPRPIGGFLMSQALLAAFGVATAAAYRAIGAYVASFLIPLLFARLSLLGARAQQELSERVQKQQQALLEASEKIFEEREQERQRIAADIHDSSLQLLAATAFKHSKALRHLRDGTNPEAQEAVVAAGAALDQAIQELRNSLADLRRSAVSEGGLLETIRNFTTDVATLWGRQVNIEGSIEHEPPVPVALAAFQILQEGLTNALKHAESGQIWVRVSDDGQGMVHIVVEDEGRGFDPSQEVGHDHVGMRLMRERASHVGGRIELESRPGSGTRLEAILPAGVEG